MMHMRSLKKRQKSVFICTDGVKTDAFCIADRDFRNVKKVLDAAPT